MPSRSTACRSCRRGSGCRPAVHRRSWRAALGHAIARHHASPARCRRKRNDGKMMGGDRMFGGMRLAIVALLVLGALPAPARADAFPTHPVHIVVPFAAGGPTDIVARVLGQGLTEVWKQQVVVDNRTGAGGNIGAEAVAKAPGDGYTLLLSTPSLAVAPAVYKKLSFRPLEDFAPVAKLGVTPTVLIVSPQLPVDSVQGLIALAKAEPGKLSFASPGQGTSL